MNRDFEVDPNELESIAREVAAVQSRCETFTRRWKARDIEPMARRTRTWITERAKQGELPQPKPAQGKFPPGFTLSQVHEILEAFRAVKHRPADQPTPVVVFHTVNHPGDADPGLALHAALSAVFRGMKVLVIDARPEAVTTRLLRFNPDRDISPAKTLSAFYAGRQEDFRYAIQNTYVPRLQLIASRTLDPWLSLPQRDGPGIDFATGLRPLLPDYDLVMIDAPVVEGGLAEQMLSLADGWIVAVGDQPQPLATTIQFLKSVPGPEEPATGPQWGRALRMLPRRGRYSIPTQSVARQFDQVFAHWDRQVFETKEVRKAVLYGHTIYEYQWAYELPHKFEKAMEPVEDLCQFIWDRTGAVWYS